MLLTVALSLAGSILPLSAAEKTTAPTAKTLWPILCAKNKFSGKKNCKMTQKILVQKTGKVLIEASISKPGPKKDKVALLLRLPTGLFLPAGITVQVDKKETHKVVVQTCDIRGCFAGMPLSEPTLAKMRKGQTLTISFMNLKKETIAIGLSLSGFTAAFKRL